MVNVCIDIGGTFTDFVVLYDEGKIESFKVSSSPRNPEQAVSEGLKKIKEPIDAVLHATTIATNALLGQIGLELPKIALITTKGFKDVIEIGRQNRPRLYDVFFEKPNPLVPRELRFEIDERTDYTGDLLKPVNKSQLKPIIEQISKLDVDSVGISFLHSYVNPSNELAVNDVLTQHFKYVTSSHEVAPEPREYERTSTVVVNVVLMPLVTRYITSLETVLESFGSPPLNIMASSGGLIDSNEASVKPVQLIESGPAAGTIAAAEFAKLLELNKIISFDMGGTTAKASTVVNYVPETTNEYEVGGQAHYGRIVKGSGYPIRFPFIDIAEVSAGGGTIISKDQADSLIVGPLSAGSDPGPICYDRGGTQPTLTDSNLALGRLPENLLSGTMKLNKKNVLTSLSKFGDPIDVAYSAIKMANLEMARAIRLVTVERGLDPSEFTLISFGGAGAQHSVEIAEELSIPEVIVPPEPGAFSAFGMLFADSKFELRLSYPQKLEDDFINLESKLTKKLGSNSQFIRYADVRYVGQGWELVISVDNPSNIEHIKNLFQGKHQQVYGFKLDKEIEIVTIRVFASLSRLKPKLKSPLEGNKPKNIGSCQTYFGKWLETKIYRREDLPLNFVTQGPALIEEYGSTTLVPPNWSIKVKELGALVLYQ